MKNYISIKNVQEPVRQMEDESIDSGDVSCMNLKSDKPISSNEELMLFMHRFNLDWDTVEIMPAFEKHCKEFFNKEKLEE